MFQTGWTREREREEMSDIAKPQPHLLWISIKARSPSGSFLSLNLSISIENWVQVLSAAHIRTKPRVGNSEGRWKYKTGAGYYYYQAVGKSIVEFVDIGVLKALWNALSLCSFFELILLLCKD